MEGWGGLGIFLVLGVAFGGVSILLSSLVGPRNPTPEKEAPYECGMPPVGDARERQSVKFYLVAMIFLLFDIEVAFLYPWAVQFGKVEGWAMVWLLLPFLIMLEVAYLYLFRKGALDWED